ncbi:MAG TPA: BamA/TamA family outer membrane protein [Longimicrobiaceae bacterium]|nr:BamA/TamA family outer membrane protein [Longimicrobiaceae bacterium]
MHRRSCAQLVTTLAAALVLSGAPRVASGQDPDSLPAARPDSLPVCGTGRISRIFVDNHPVFDATESRLDPRFDWVYHLANRLHISTREGVIRREVLFREGDCYAPEVLLDSERLLRNTTFIADADIYGIRQPDSTYHVIVDTDDEWSTRLEPRMDSRNGGLEGLELREDNLLGTGQQVAAYWGEQFGERIFGVSYATPQLLGTQLDAELAMARTSSGALFSGSLAYPFRGENGRWALRQRFEHEDRYFEYLAQAVDGRRVRVLFPEQRRSMELGGVFRLGRRGNLTLFGVALAGEWIEYPGGTRFSREEENTEWNLPLLDPMSTAFDSVSSVRVVFLAGQRSVYFVRRSALDAVRGTEDVRLGAEAELAVGRSLEGLSTDNDLALDLGLFLATEFPGGVLSGGRVVVEGKRDYGAPVGSWEWSNVFAQLDAWTYWRPSPESRHTLVVALAAAGGWRTTVPFQLTLGNRSGLRGFPRHATAGAQRAVLSLEDRFYLGWPYPQLFDLGGAAFVDVGRSWAGSHPFARDSPLEASAGVGLRVAFPPGSRRTYRVDVAFPVTGGGGLGDVVVSLGVGQAIGRQVRDDPQIRRSSRRSLSASLFSYPN